ncbi:MAG: CRISPR-associated helicase Cas3' [Panacagrimonas sp.]
MTAAYWNYWGKARPGDGAVTWHPLPCHCLDVAAVGREFLYRAPVLRGFWSHRLGLTEDAFTDLCTFFLALHDLGKFAVPFQAQRADLLASLQQGRQTLKTYGPRHYHDSLGAALAAGHWEHWAELEWLDALWGGAHFEAAECWINAVTGHHGQPPAGGVTVCANFDERDIRAAAEFVDAAGNLLLPQSSRDAWLASRPADLLNEHRRFSWWLAGLSVLADWLGSNTDYFPYREPSSSLEAYWNQARGQARTALDRSGVVPRRASGRKAFAELFPKIGISQTPLQNCCDRLALSSTPQLFVLEDVTGAGKTEAAVMLAHRLLQAGLGEGLYFALPTMATANQMYQRIGEVYDHLFEPGSRPSLVLAHGARDLSKAFRSTVLPKDSAEPEYEKLATASQRCTAWLADTRKAALLAQVGVGTIDQALMAVLHAKHQSLRLLGLFGKVLIVDEVHACDSYLFGVLKTLLRFHREAGGSAILLSATLPQQMRRELCAIYSRTESMQSSDYPLLTHADEAGLREIPVATRSQVVRRVDVQWLRDPAACEAYVLEAARAGKAVCWIRNTVSDAIASYRALKAAHPHTQLFHARFALGDRLRIENEALERFGKKVDADRAGQVLVATQVVEQSLDLDFDVMVSDIAPIDLLIQRAGRLHRHERGDRGVPTLAIHAPPALPDADPKWMGPHLRKSAYVYPNLAQLWLSVRELSTRGGWHMPTDARAMIEAVYGPDAADQIPTGLSGVNDTQTGNRQAEKSLAMTNTLSLSAGYVSSQSGGGNWSSEAHTPTRLGEPSVTLHLLRWADGKLSDFFTDDNRATAAGLSRLSVRASQINEEAESDDPGVKAALSQWRERMGRAAKWVVAVPLIERNGEWMGGARQVSEGRAARSLRLRYSADEGLSWKT